jgi:hypothetical protein
MNSEIKRELKNMINTIPLIKIKEIILSKYDIDQVQFDLMVKALCGADCAV